MFEHVATRSVVSTLSTFTFTDVPLGDAASDRYIFIAARGWRGNGTLAVTGITVAGAATAEVVAANFSVACVAIRRTSSALTTGTTGTITVTLSNTSAGCHIDVYRAVALVSTTPTDTANPTTNSANTVTGNIDVSDNGGVLAAALGIRATGNQFYGSGAHDFLTSAEAGRPVTPTHGGSGIGWSGAVKDSQEDISSGTTGANWMLLAAASFAFVAGTTAALSGVAAAPSAAALSAAGGASAPVTGVAASPAVAALSATGGASAALPSVETSPAPGTFEVTGGSILTLPGVTASPAAAEMIAQQGAETVLAGVAALADAGAFEAQGGAIAALESVTASPEAAALQTLGLFALDFITSPDAAAQYLIEITAFRTDGTSGGLAAIAEIAIASLPPGSATTGGEVQLRFADIDWQGDPDDAHHPNLWYDGRVAMALRCDRTAPLYPEEARRATRQFGALELINADGRLDEIVRHYSVGGRPVRVMLGPYLANYADFAPVAVMAAIEWQPGEDSVRLNLREVATELDRPLQQVLYLGTGGVEGTADVGGKPKPIAGGFNENVTPTQISALHLIYQANDGPTGGIPAVYDRAGVLNLDTDAGDGGDLEDYDALEAVSVATSKYATCLALGLFKLGSSPAGLVTCDVQGDATGGYTDEIGELARRIITTRAGIAEASVEIAGFDELTTLGGPVGYYISSNESPTGADVLNRLVASAGGWWGPSRLGRIRAGRLKDPAAQTPDYRLDSYDILTISEEPTPRLRWRHRASYRRNWTVQRGEDLNVTVSEERRQFLAEAALVAAPLDAQNGALLSRYLNAVDTPVLETLLNEKEDADALAIKMQELFGVPRQILRLTVNRLGYLFDFGTILHLTYPRFGLANGKRFAVIGIGEESTAGEIQLRVWG